MFSVGNIAHDMLKLPTQKVLFNMHTYFTYNDEMKRGALTRTKILKKLNKKNPTSYLHVETSNM